MDLPGITAAEGLEKQDAQLLEELLEVWRNRAPKNQKLTQYFEGKTPVKSIGLDNIPETVTAASRVDWAGKAVTSISERVRLDGFVFTGDGEEEDFQQLVKTSGLCQAYNQIVASQLVHGCAFATVDMGTFQPRVFFYAADSAAGIWDDMTRGLKAGFTIPRRETTEWSGLQRVPTLVHLYTSEATISIQRLEASHWQASYHFHQLNRPLIEALTFRPTGVKPLGQSRITPTVRYLVDETQRTLLYMGISAAVYATPLIAALGLSEDQLAAMNKPQTLADILPGTQLDGSDKPKPASGWLQKAGSWFLATANEDGTVPTLQMLSGQSPQPYVDAISTYAKLFSGATGVPLNSLGIVQDNPSSAEAIEAAREDICTAAEDLIESNRHSLTNIALLTLAMLENCPIEDLSETQLSVMPRFKNPSRPSLASTADAMVKIAGVLEGFSSTQEFLAGMGFSAAEVESIKTQIRQNQARQQALALAQQAASQAATAASTEAIEAAALAAEEAEEIKSGTEEPGTREGVE